MVFYLGVQIFVFTIIGILSCIALLFYIKDRRKSKADDIFQQHKVRESKEIKETKETKETKDSHASSLFGDLDFSQTTNGTEKYYGDSLLHCYSEEEDDITRAMNHYYTDEVTGKKTHHPGFHGDFSCSSFATSYDGEHNKNNKYLGTEKIQDEPPRKELHLLTNTYTETLKLAHSCPEYIDTYLDKCYGRLDNTVASFDENEIDISTLIFDFDDMADLASDECVQQIEKLRFALSLELNESPSIFHQIVRNSNFWTNLIADEQTNINLRAAAFRLIADFVSYQGEDEIMDSAIYLKFVSSMVQGIQFQTDDILYGVCLRSLFAVLCSVSVEDFILVCFDYWYREEESGSFKDSSPVEEIKLELLKLVLAKSINQLKRDSKVWTGLISNVYDRIVERSTDSIQIRAKKQELKIIIETLETATETENTEPMKVHTAKDAKNFKRRLSTSRKASSERPKKQRALGDIKNTTN